MLIFYVVRAIVARVHSYNLKNKFLEFDICTTSKKCCTEQYVGLWSHVQINGKRLLDMNLHKYIVLSEDNNGVPRIFALIVQTISSGNAETNYSYSILPATNSTNVLKDIIDPASS